MPYLNDLLLRAARGEETERTPVWLMRQAGRFLPEYRSIRNNLSGFIELVKSPELAAEVTIQPVDYLDVDAAIIFSDILVIPEAMGLPYQMIEKSGPFFPVTVDSDHILRKLKVADAESDLGYVMEAIRLTKKWLNNRVPLIGFAGAPWTIFAYMVEGSGSKTFSRAKRLLYNEPFLSHQLLDMITESTIAYLKAQVKAGADLVQVFDSWAGILNQDLFNVFSLEYIKRICNAISEVPVTVFCRGAWFAMDDLEQLDCNVIGIDWTFPVSKAREKMPTKVLQGNLDPCALYGSYETIENETRKMLHQFGPTLHIANLGHGIYPDLQPEKVKCFVDTVKEQSLLMR